MSIFSDRFRELRGNKRQSDVATALGITAASVGYYENAKRTPDIEMLIKIAEYYQVSADYLIGVPNAIPPTDEKMAEVTGLSKKSVKYLMENHDTDEIKAINLIIEGLANGKA